MTSLSRKRSQGRRTKSFGSFGIKFAEKRKSLGWTQAQTAAFFGRTRVTIARWETQMIFPNPKDRKLMKRLGQFEELQP
jgi:DNA-binding transcriptional regulator YiaG